MTLQEQLLYTTLRIERLDSQGNALSVGTGFLLQRPVDKERAKIYLVSNKHVIHGADGVAFTFTGIEENNPEAKKQTKVSISDIKNKVIGHSNPEVDVAVVEITNIFNLYPDRFYFKRIPYEILADFTEPELTVAENVFFIGYPDDRYDTTNNLPLVRQGMIASHPKYDYNGTPTFIIDAQVFPGSSGSPVFIDLTYENIKNGHIVVGGKRNIKLLGIVAQTMVRNNQLKAVPAGTKFYVQDVLGLGIVFKATTIKELIDQMPL